MGKNSGGKKNDNNHSNQKNLNNTDLSHNNSAYKSGQDNHANQLNPNNPNYGGGKK